ncbi:MAG: 16S rRNA (cytosine(1402)-N(4))-methyltransferase RsmH [Gemmatales bacterium]|nr:16S rRNA (cytosine(1402)-N(4))-methyltransferase RsmH [Gemmatales bacterium]MDW8387774.1 16S rRNA (cytosine(1402)-N(4))-methyltransferase RsmH [Gemmatales bacterium]
MSEPASPLHIPVMPLEVLRWLDPQPGQIIVDATVGGGGHALRIAQRIAPNGCLIGIDQDEAMLRLARNTLKDAPAPVTLVHGNFAELRHLLDEQKVDRVHGVLADLGFASDQLADPRRGLSFQAEGPLDMRLDPSRGEPASRLVNRLSERELADIFWRYGEERFSRRVARRIVEIRQKQPITTTTQLADLVRRCVPRSRGGMDPATRVFQALRIAVNDELEALEQFLEQLPRCLKPEGRAVVISFHSLEDRLVKNAFRSGPWEVLTRKPVTPSEAEISTNPRSRSAKLRAARLKSAA